MKVNAAVLTDFDLLMTGEIEGENEKHQEHLRRGFSWLKEVIPTDKGELKSIDSNSWRLNYLLRRYTPGIILNFFGSRASGKTQILTQMAVNAAKVGTVTIFVDCSGSFRPERVVEMARGQSLMVEDVLRNILVVRCFSIAQQMDLVETVKREARISDVKERKRRRIMLIDDITENFILGSSETTNIELRSLLARHLHQLSHFAVDDLIPIVLTNSTRSRINQGSVKEVQTLSSIVERGTHTRIHIERIRRMGVWLATDTAGERCEFQISERGLVDLAGNSSAINGGLT
jgi:RecA/RadA recombinase